MEAREISNKFPGIIDVLRYHIATGRYNYVDRIAAAMDARVVEDSIREALRAITSIVGSVPRKAEVKLLEYSKDEKRYKPSNKTTVVIYVEDEKFESPEQIPGRVWLHGTVGLDAEGKVRAFYTQPLMPSENEIAEFIDSIRQDLEVARTIASLAMTKKIKEGD
ncbi:MAG: hypothetical protein ACXQTU_04855 [Candidatus Nezhaarchaeales archaeon]